jgi:uncharacterized peroxidase-related enzyme
MSRIPSLTDDQASAEAAPLLKAVQAKLGMVPNMIRTIANSPAALRGYLSLSEALGSGSFNGAERETIALAVAQANACGYCLSAHTMIGKGAGLTPDAIIAARQGEGSPLAQFARAVTVSRGDLKPADLEAARAAGLSDGQIIEMIAHVALNTLTNYVNRIAQTDIDFPVVAV